MKDSKLDNRQKNKGICTACGKPIGTPHDWAYYGSTEYCDCQIVFVDSKPKEASIEAKLDYFISENSSKAKDILPYLSSHGFGDIERAKKEGAKDERERIIKELDNDRSLALFDDSYLRLLVNDTLETLRTSKTHKQRADENYDRLQALKQEGK